MVVSLSHLSLSLARARAFSLSLSLSLPSSRFTTPHSPPPRARATESSALLPTPTSHLSLHLYLFLPLLVLQTLKIWSDATPAPAPSAGASSSSAASTPAPTTTPVYHCDGTLYGHQDYVTAVTPHPTGDLLSGSRDTNLIQWNPLTFAPRHDVPFLGHTLQVSSVGVALFTGAPISAGLDGTVRVWDQGRDGAGGASTSTSTQSNTLSSSTSTPSSRVLSGGSQGAHTGPVLCLVVLKDGTLATGSGDMTVRVWDLASGEVVRVLKGHTDTVRSLCGLPGALERGGGALGGGIDNPSPSSSSSSSSPAGVVSASHDLTIRLWCGDGSLMRTLTGHEGIIYAVARAPTGDRLVSGSEDNTMRIWSGTTGNCLQVRHI